MEHAQKTITKYSLLTVAGLIAYFFTMKFFGLEHNFELRLFNAAIMYIGIYFTLKELRNKNQDDLEYLNGLGSGLIFSIVVGLLFSFFIGTYTYNSPDFMASIKANEPQGIYMNEVAIGILVFIEALASGVLFTYATMQFIKSKKKSVASSTN